MKLIFVMVLVIFSLSFNAFGSENKPSKPSQEQKAVVWVEGMNVETFWLNYVNSNGGLTWDASTVYPEYEKVKEGDTFIIQLNEGPCLMEFFHSRWRMANDVRRWNDSMNTYGGCPYVFD